MLDGKRDCNDEIKILVTRFKSDINAYGLGVAEKIIRSAQDELKKIAARYAAEIDECTKNFVARIEDDVKAYENSAFFRQVDANLQICFRSEQRTARAIRNARHHAAWTICRWRS